MLDKQKPTASAAGPTPVVQSRNESGQGRTLGLRLLQRYPHLLEMTYTAADRFLHPFRRWLKPGGTVEWLMIRTEKLTKGAIFDCRMCGQCVLHSTGMTCPMTCPKNLRNGPCGGVRPDGHCEMLPEKPCVWVQAWERSQRMPVSGSEIHKVLPPLDQSHSGTSAWINHFAHTAEGPQAWPDLSEDR